MDWKFPANWPAPEKYLIELGRILSLWGTLESNVNIAISQLAGYQKILDWRAAVLTAHSNFKQRIDIFSTLCDQLQHEHPHLSNYKKVVNRIVKIQKMRNKYAHNSMTWNEEKSRVEIGSMSARGKLKTNIEEVKVEDLKSVSAQIHETMLELHYIITGVRHPPLWER